MKKSLVCAAMTALIPFASHAGEVNPSSVTTFQSQTPAVAAEVNANFSALITAINDNAQRIAALEAAAADSSVAGKSYKLLSLAPDLGVGDDESFANISAGSTDATISFDASGTSGTLNSAGETFYEVNLPGNNLTDFSDSGGTSNFSYVQSGTTITVTFPGEPNLVLTASQDGSVLIGSDKSFDLGATFGANDDIPGQQASISLIVAIQQGSVSASP